MANRGLLSHVAIALAGVTVGRTKFGKSPMSVTRRTASSFASHRLGWAGAVRLPQHGSTVALGDSLTAGHTLPLLRMLADDSYVDILAHDGTIALVANRAVSGSNSRSVARRAPADIPVGVERVIVLAGTNDVLKIPELDTVKYLETIRRAIVERGAQSVFGLLPPLDRLPEEVRARNESIRGWADLRPEVILVDHHSVLSAPDGTFLPGLSTDGVHVTRAGAQIMASATRARLAEWATSASA